MKFLKLTALASLASALKIDWSENGANWPKDFPNCAKPYQSPIDLKTTGVPVIQYRKDAYAKHYQNLVDATISWLPDKGTNLVEVDADAGNNQVTSNNWFKSNVSDTEYGGSRWWYAMQFHFHWQSEHTIDGKRYDMEMHTVHLPKTDDNHVQYSALGILFDVNNYDKNVTQDEIKIIDNFFDSLKLDQTGNPKGNIPYGDLYSILDTSNRWVYQGSVTTPPCQTIVYWNVLKKVYPIKQKHLDQYRNVQLAQDPLVAKNGNWRVIQKIDKQDVKFISSDPEDTKLASYETQMIVCIVLLVVFALAFFFLLLSYCGQRTTIQQLGDNQGLINPGPSALNTSSGEGDQKQLLHKNPKHASKARVASVNADMEKLDVDDSIDSNQ